jgi:hypothetical protein
MTAQNVCGAVYVAIARHVGKGGAPMKKPPRLRVTAFLQTT